VPAALLYSCRTREDVIYHEELDEIAQNDAAFMLRITLTRERPPGWSGALGRIDIRMIQTLVERLGGVVDCFVCGRDGFVETASVLLMKAGQPGHAIRTERFGPTGASGH
jgi:ferredoxin-NADP reductase